MMIKPTCLVPAALLLSLSLPATARELPIGTHGATITLDESWQRQELSPDVGPDQFMNEGGLFTVVLENRALLERRVDFELEMEIYLSNLQARFQDTELDPVIDYQRYGDVGHCSRRLQGKFQSLHLAYQLDIVSRDGLGYLLMTWAAASKAQQAHDTGNQLAQAITFPDAESEWAQRAEPTAHGFRFDDWQIELSYRDSVFANREDGDQLYSLTTFEETVAIHVFLDEYEDLDLESAVDDIVRVVSEDEERLEELERIDLELAAGPGRQALLRQRTEQNSYDIAVVMVEVADSTYVDLRLISAGETGHRERLWTSILESLRVTPPPQVAAFPVVEQTAESAPSSLNRAARALLTGAAWLDTGGTSLRSAVPAGGGSVVVLEPRRVVKVESGAEPSVLFKSEDWISDRQLVVAGGEILLVGSDQQVSKVAERQLQPADFEARYAAAAGSDLVLVRAGKASQMLGFERLDNPDSSRLVVRSRSGDELIVGELEDLTISAMTASPDGARALLAGRDRNPLGGSGFGDGVRLVEIDLSSAARRPLGAWSQIRALAAADAGWLVSGAPRDGLQGLYLLGAGDSAPTSGQRELLISGDVSGVELRDGELTFTADVCLNAEGESSGTCLYRAAIELVREHGPACWPLRADTVNRIAEEVKAAGGGRLAGTADRAELSSLMAAANSACERLTSLPLPSSPAAVDGLLRDLMSDKSLSDDAIALLAVVMSDALVRQGAVWVGSSTPAPIRAEGLGVVAENDFAVAAHPIQVMISTLYQEEGWWNPVQNLVDRADGRALLVGHDRQALVSAVEQRQLPAVAELLEQGKLARLQRLLEEHRQNLHLRDRVYRHLAAGGRGADLTRLARDFATVDEPAARDLRAWLAGRLSLAPEGKDLDRLIDDLKAAITGHPDLAALYLLLGSAYERTAAADSAAVEDRLDLARACYRKASELARWGEITDAADRAIERLDQAG